MSQQASTAQAPGSADSRRSGLSRPRGTAVTAAVLLIAAIIFPQVITNEVTTQIGVDTMLFVASAIAWNLFSGFTGYISLGHAVFFGVGAYTVAIAAQDWHLTGDMEFALLPLAGLVAGLVAVPFGLIALRVRRHTFVVVTIAVFFIFQLMAFDFGFTGGSVGLYAPFLTWAPQTFNNPFYYIALGLAAGTGVLSWLIHGSRFGLQLRAIRDDEDRARGLGVRVMPVKLTAFVISGVVTGLVGAVWFFFIGQVLPQYGFDPLFDLSVALMTFFGGFGTLWGPVLGALVLEPGEQFLTLRVSNSYVGELIWGSLFLLVILFMSRGVLPIAGEKVTAWRARRGRAVAVLVPASPAAAGEAAAGEAVAGDAAALSKGAPRESGGVL